MKYFFTLISLFFYNQNLFTQEIINPYKIEIEKLDSSEPLLKSMTLNCNRARKELDGWKPKIILQEGLEKMYELLSVERPWI